MPIQQRGQNKNLYVLIAHPVTAPACWLLCKSVQSGVTQRHARFSVGEGQVQCEKCLAFSARINLPSRPAGNCRKIQQSWDTDFSPVIFSPPLFDNQICENSALHWKSAKEFAPSLLSASKKATAFPGLINLTQSGEEQGVGDIASLEASGGPSF